MVRVLLGLLAVGIAVAAFAVDDAAGKRAPAAPSQGAVGWPAVSGQGSTVLVRFTSVGCDDGIDSATCGYEIALNGPDNTPCAGRFGFDEIVFFPAGPATFRIGPKARPTRGRRAERVHAYRPTSVWCPGVYRGTVTYLASNEAPGPMPAPFTFRIDRTRAGPLARGRAPKDPIRGFCRPQTCDI
jgi:hypothetical protein